MTKAAKAMRSGRRRRARISSVVESVSLQSIPNHVNYIISESGRSFPKYLTIEPTQPTFPAPSWPHHLRLVTEELGPRSSHALRMDSRHRVVWVEPSTQQIVSSSSTKHRCQCLGENILTMTTMMPIATSDKARQTKAYSASFDLSMLNRDVSA